MEKPRFIRKNGRIIPIYSKKKTGVAQVAGGAAVAAGATAISSAGLAVSRKKNFQAYSLFTQAKNFKKTMDMVTTNTIRSGRNFKANAALLESLGNKARNSVISGNKIRKTAKLLRAGSLVVAGVGVLVGETLVGTGIDNLDSKKKSSNISKNAAAIGTVAAVTFGASKFKGTKRLAKLAASKFK